MADDPNNSNVAAATDEEVPPTSAPTPAPPPTPVLVSQMEMAGRFLLWPLVFIVFNVLVFATLVVFDDSNEPRRSRPAQVGRFGQSNAQDSSSIISMLRYNATVSLITFILDALILRHAVQWLERELQAAASAEAEPTSSRRVPASVQISKVLDTVLGMERADNNATAPTSAHSLNPSGTDEPSITSASLQTSQPSVLVTVLLLGGGAAVALAGATVIAGVATYSSFIQEICALDYSPPPSLRIKHLPLLSGVPRELQTWAQNFAERGGETNSQNVVRLDDGTLYFVAKGHVAPSTRRDHWPKLAAIEQPAGKLRFYPNVNGPRDFCVVQPSEATTNKEEPDPYTARQFCLQFYDPNPRRTSILCVESGDQISLATGVFRNITLYNDDLESMISATMRVHEGVVWVAIFWDEYVVVADRRRAHASHQMRLTVELLNLRLDQPSLQLISVANVSTPDAEWNDSGSCESWMGPTFLGALTVCLLLSSLALYQVYKVPTAGVTLASVAILIGLKYVNYSVTVILGSIVVSGAFFVLRGAGLATRVLSALPWSIRRDEVVCILYTTLFGLLTVERDFVHGLVVCAGTGVLLEHPVLFLMGWVAGPLAVVGALYNFLVGEPSLGMFLLFFGIVGGPGCITVSYFLQSHRAYLIYHARRTWSRMTRSGQTVPHRM